MKTVIRRTFFLYMLLVYSLILSAQKHIVDSLLRILQNQQEDTTKVNTLFELSEICDESDILKYAEPALALAEKLNYKKGIADASSNIGYLYGARGNFIKALEYGEKSLKLRRELGDQKKISTSLNNIGYIYYGQGAVSKALEYFHKSLAIKEKTGDQVGTVNLINNIAEIYNSQGDTIKAIEYWQNCLALSKKIDYKFGVGLALYGLGYCYRNMEDGKKAAAYYEECLSIREQIDDKEGQGNVLNSMGMLYFQQGMYEKAEQYLSKSLKIAREINDWQGLTTCLNNLSRIFVKQGNYKSAVSYSQEALVIAQNMGAPSSIGKASELLSTIYAEMGTYKEAYKMHRLFKQMSDSVSNSETRKAVVKKQMQYEFDKREAAAKAEQDKKNLLAQAEIRHQKLIRNFSLLGVVVVILFSILSIYRYRHRKQLQNLQALTNERLRISRELHDEVGSTLSGIAMYSHLTREQIKNANTDKIVNSLNIMQQSADEMVNKLNDIVWLLKPEQDSLKNLIKRLEEYARDMAIIKNMQVKINVPEKLSEHRLQMESRRNIYLVCKEAVNNAVKYSNGTILELNVKEANGVLEFSVSDDGKGFDRASIKRGNGLENMQKRAGEIGARLTLQSKQNQGTLLSLQLKIT
jgi:two-component system, NarL family, sensor histidine kinase UhpB